MRTEVKSVDRSAFSREAPPKVSVHVAYVVFGGQAACDDRLIGHHEDESARGASESYGFESAGEKLERLRVERLA
jgi:hypothetical protein